MLDVEIYQTCINVLINCIYFFVLSFAIHWYKMYWLMQLLPKCFISSTYLSPAPAKNPNLSCWYRYHTGWCRPNEKIHRCVFTIVIITFSFDWTKLVTTVMLSKPQLIYFLACCTHCARFIPISNCSTSASWTLTNWPVNPRWQGSHHFLVLTIILTLAAILKAFFLTALPYHYFKTPFLPTSWPDQNISTVPPPHLALGHSMMWAQWRTFDGQPPRTINRPVVTMAISSSPVSTFSNSPKLNAVPGWWTPGWKQASSFQGQCGRSPRCFPRLIFCPLSPQYPG